MLLLGIDLGTSSTKVSVIDAATRECINSAQFPEEETDIISLQPGWAEQDPETWWVNIQQAILKCHSSSNYDSKDIAAIGIAYQMHGLVMVDKEQRVLRNSIIWCDSRAVETGNKAFKKIGEEKSLSHLLNSPGNFTASKLAWVKENEPEIYVKADKIMLPGDFIAMKLTGTCTTTPSALSEGIFWDFQTNGISKDIVDNFKFDESLFPSILPLFSSHGQLKGDVAEALKLSQGIPVSYKAGDQLNNALALNVLEPGEVASTAGTSGVIYGVSDELHYDKQSRINSFCHVNHPVSTKENDLQKARIGILLCINGVGIFNRWVRNLSGQLSYDAMNTLASKVPIGSEGLIALPFGNGAERMLNNAIIGSQVLNIDLNIHGIGHLVRAAQEGIACAFRYGLDIMRDNGISPTVIRASKSNLFKSDVFTQSFANINNTAIEFYDGDGSFGAAIGAGIGAGIYKNAGEASSGRKPLGIVQPASNTNYEGLYENWKNELLKYMK